MISIFYETISGKKHSSLAFDLFSDLKVSDLPHRVTGDLFLFKESKLSLFFPPQYNQRDSVGASWPPLPPSILKCLFWFNIDDKSIFVFGTILQSEMTNTIQLKPLKLRFKM